MDLEIQQFGGFLSTLATFLASSPIPYLATVWQIARYIIEAVQQTKRNSKHILHLVENIAQYLNILKGLSDQELRDSRSAVELLACPLRDIQQFCESVRDFKLVKRVWKRGAIADEIGRLHRRFLECCRQFTVMAHFDSARRQGELRAFHISSQQLLGSIYGSLDALREDTRLMFEGIWRVLEELRADRNTDRCRRQITFIGSFENSYRRVQSRLEPPSHIPELTLHDVEVLLAHGADVDARDADGWTALHRAADGGHLGIVKILVAKGADNKLRAKREGLYVTAVELALANNRDQVVDFLLSRL